MATHRVVAGYVTAETAVPGGRAHVDIPRGELLPADVPDDQVLVLLGRGHIEPVEEAVPTPAGVETGEGQGDSTGEGQGSGDQGNGTGGDEGDPQGGPSNQEIRDWARLNGVQVSDKGRIPSGVVDAYNAAVAAKAAQANDE